MGLFDFIGDTVDSWTGTDIGSELGGIADDWLGTAPAANPATQFSGWGDLFSPGFFSPGGAGNPSSSGGYTSGTGYTTGWPTDFPGPALDTSIPITLGGGMDELSLEGFGDPGYGVQGGAMARRIPWATIFAVLGAATRTFGAQMLPAVVSALGSRIGVPPGQILFRYLKRKGRRRSTRGITGRQLSITRRTIGKVNRMYSLLHRGGGRARPAPFRRRRRA